MSDAQRSSSGPKAPGGDIGLTPGTRRSGGRSSGNIDPQRTFYEPDGAKDRGTCGPHREVGRRMRRNGVPSQRSSLR